LKITLLKKSRNLSVPPFTTIVIRKELKILKKSAWIGVSKLPLAWMWYFVLAIWQLEFIHDPIPESASECGSSSMSMDTTRSLFGDGRDQNRFLGSAFTWILFSNRTSLVFSIWPRVSIEFQHLGGPHPTILTARPVQIVFARNHFGDTLADGFVIRFLPTALKA